MLCFLTVKKRLERRSVIPCYHGSKISRSQKSFWDGRKVRARNALATGVILRKSTEPERFFFFFFFVKAGLDSRPSRSRSRSRKRSRKGAYDLVKIKIGVVNGVIIATGSDCQKNSNWRFHFFRHRLRLNRLRLAYDLVKTRLPESEAKTEVGCSRLSDSGEDAKEKGTRKVGGAGKRTKERRESL